MARLSASVCAPPTNFDALLHQLVAGRQSLTVFSTAVANFSANRADAAMKIGIAKHEISGALAYLGTIEQQSNTLRLRVIAAFVQAVRHRLQADVVAIGHDLYVMIRMVSHESTSFVFAETKRKKHAPRAGTGQI